MFQTAMDVDFGVSRRLKGGCLGHERRVRSFKILDRGAAGEAVFAARTNDTWLVSTLQPKPAAIRSFCRIRAPRVLGFDGGARNFEAKLNCGRLGNSVCLATPACLGKRGDGRKAERCGKNAMWRKQTYAWRRKRSLEEIDQALTLVNGSFVAAAKLLDMEPQKFRNAVNYHATLKNRWRKGRGRPRQVPSFRIEPFVEDRAKAALREANLDREIVRLLSFVDRVELKAWLEGRFREAKESLFGRWPVTASEVCCEHSAADGVATH